MPCFYRGAMFHLNPDDTADLKLYNSKSKDWEWVSVTLRRTDLAYLTKLNAAFSAPTLAKRNRRFELVFSYKGTVTLPKKTDLVCAVDLGINTDAVCSVMRKDGTVLARKFLNCAKDKDYLRRIRSQIREAQARGNRKTPRLWRFQNMRNHEISVKTARGIVAFASSFGVQTIVFEYLDLQGKRRNQHIALWRKREIQDITTRLAHRRGIRISRVSARNTSRLAFDGSGEVARDEHNYSLCTFQTGKQYNCDLSASYNIGARYFIRQAWNTLSREQQAACSAKDPDLQQRTRCTLSTLIRLSQTLRACAGTV